MTIELMIALVPVIAGIIGVWVNLNSTVARLKSRVVQLELSQDELKKDIKELLKSVHNIELMIAKMNAE
jgi:prefoldin subunit 5